MMNNNNRKKIIAMRRITWLVVGIVTIMIWYNIYKIFF